MHVLVAVTVLALSQAQPAPSNAREGYIPVPGGRVWYRIVGQGSSTPLLVLHGGPGVPHDYLEPLEALSDERRVVFYDQLGCGKSDRPEDNSLWTVARFVEELREVRKALQLDRVHLLGHSWGTMLATDYFLTKPAGVQSLVLASPALSADRWLKDAELLKRELPPEVQAVIVKHETAGTTESEEYQGAVMEYYKRHLCRLDPFPDPVVRSFQGIGQSVYLTMWGPSEFTATGSLKGYDHTRDLKNINVPTLFTCGRYDEATPEATASYQNQVPGARLVVFEKSAHMAHIEETAEYLKTLRAFLRDAERQK